MTVTGQISFSHVYAVDGSPTYAINGTATGGPFLISESADLNSSFSPSEVVTISGFANSFTVVGHISGAPNAGVLLSQTDVFGTTYFFFSNNVIADDTPLTSLNTSTPFCLLSGTKIQTIRGIVNVEDLIPGDLVLDSQGSYSPVRWVGVQTLSPIFSGKASWPVKISKDALGENTPDKDLYVSQDHAIFLHGALICAEALVNGSTITLEKPAESSIKYYGLDLGPATIHPVHNLPVGSLGAGAREYFDNYQEWLDSGHELIDEPLMFPRVKHASQLPGQLRKDISA
jgi:hypothetical protein